jgi:hypothetical protein
MLTEYSGKILGARLLDSSQKRDSVVITEMLDGIGIRGSGYHRSLPLHERGEYNFSTTTRPARKNGIKHA